MPDDLKNSILSIFEASPEAQLRAVRRLRSGQPKGATTQPRPGLSQVDIAYDIPKKARTPLHISDRCPHRFHFLPHRRP